MPAKSPRPRFARITGIGRKLLVALLTALAFGVAGCEFEDLPREGLQHDRFENQRSFDGVPFEDAPREDAAFEKPSYEGVPFEDVPLEETSAEDSADDDTTGAADDGPSEFIAQGGSCKDVDVPCAPDLECIEYYGFGGATTDTFATCEIPCDVKTRCPEGQVCTHVSDGPGLVCR